MVKWIRHNQGLFVASAITILLIFWSIGCQTTVQSPISGKQVTRPQLKLEVDLQVKQMELELDRMYKEAQLQFAELDRQDEVKRKLFEFASVAATQQGFNPLGLITLAGSILGAGLLVDNRVKDKVIKNRPLNNGPPPKGK